MLPYHLARSRSIFSTNHHSPLLREVVFRNLEIERRRAFSRSTRYIVMRAVARAEPATEIAGLADRNASQVGAYADHDEPFGLLDAVFVFLRVAEDGDAGECVSWDRGLAGESVTGLAGALDGMYLLYAFSILDFVFCPVSDEDGLAAPFDDHVFAEWDCR